MLKSRLISAAIIISTSLTFVTLDVCWPISNGLWMVLLGFGLVFGSCIECVRMVGRSEYGSIAAPALLGAGGIMLASTIPLIWPLFGEPYPIDCPLGRLGWPLAAAILALFCCICWFIPRYEPGSSIFMKCILAGWVSVYFGGCFAFAVSLRQIGSIPTEESVKVSPTWGLYVLVGVILITKFADSGAYFTGKSLGRNKLCPQVSPGKTIEGLIGGMLTACFAGWIYFAVCAPLVYGPTVKVAWIGVVSMGVLLTIAGVIGDLVESLFKREMNCKDSGNLLPGLGGLWDVTDSLLPGFAMGYLVIVAGWIEGPLVS